MAIDEGVALITAAPESATTCRPQPDGWCAREIVGHLIDSACNNHRRFIITLMVEALDVNPKLSAKFQRILRRMRYFLADVVRRGQADGTVRPDVDPEQTAALIAATIMGAEIQHYQDPGEVDLRRVLDTLVVQLGDWLMPRTHVVANAGGITA